MRMESELNVQHTVAYEHRALKKTKGRKRIEAAPKMAIPSVEPIGSDWNRPNCLEFLSHWP